MRQADICSHRKLFSSMIIIESTTRALRTDKQATVILFLFALFIFSWTKQKNKWILRRFDFARTNFIDIKCESQAESKREHLWESERDVE